MAITEFWGILSISFFLLAFLSYIATKKPINELKEFSEHRSGTFIRDHDTGENLSKFETSLYNILLYSAWINFVAFILAAVAAYLSFY